MGLSRIFADFVFHCLASQKAVAVVEPGRNSGKSVPGLVARLDKLRELASSRHLSR
jgi:hypothetical protein